MKNNKTAFYLITAYVIMQLSGALFAPLIFRFLNGQEGMGEAQAKLLASGWWIFISMSIAALISVAIIRKDKSFLNNLKGKKSSIPASIGWGILGFFMVLIGQAIVAVVSKSL